MVVKTEGRGGSKLRKRFTVHTNDPQQPRVDLYIMGTVKAFVNFSPRHVNLRGVVGEKVSMTVSIQPIKEYPFTIKEVKARDGKNIHYTLKPMGPNPAKDGYHLIVANAKTDSGNYHDTITIHTTSSVKPEIKIHVVGRINPKPVS